MFKPTKKENDMTTWYYAILGTDQPPIFRNIPVGEGWIGPFDTKDSAINHADDALSHDINVLRRSLSALRRGDYV